MIHSHPDSLEYNLVNSRHLLVFISHFGYTSEYRSNIEKQNCVVVDYKVRIITANIFVLGIEILYKTHVILSTLPITLLIYIMTLCAGINISHLVMEFYHHRVV